jgi:hypothetical protein
MVLPFLHERSMMRFDDTENSADFMCCIAARTCDSQGLQPQLGIITPSTFSLTNMHVGRFAQIRQDKVERVALLAMDNWTHK